MTSFTAVRARSVGLVRAVLGALLLLSGVAVLHACVIEERPFDEHLAACDDYCREVANKCTGADAIYESAEQCMAVCEQIPLGSADEPAGSNSLRCRRERLHAGGFEAGVICPAAAPGGNGTCGNDCESLCALRRQACGAAQPNKREIAEPDVCVTWCNGLIDQPGYSLADDATDTVQCRLIQLARTIESPDTASTSCVQSQIAPENPTLVESVCSDGEGLDAEIDCEKYCDMVMVSCTEENGLYDSVQQCKDTCRTFQPGVHGDIELNTLRCRRYHAYAALDLPLVHCPHAGPTGDGHCSDPPTNSGNCVSYCRILEAACPTEYTAHFSAADGAPGSCLSSCLLLPDARENAFATNPRYSVTTVPEPQTLKCRTLHAVRAMSAPDDECAAAFADPGSDCE